MSEISYFSSLLRFYLSSKAIVGPPNISLPEILNNGFLHYFGTAEATASYSKFLDVANVLVIHRQLWSQQSIFSTHEVKIVDCMLPSLSLSLSSFLPSVLLSFKIFLGKTYALQILCFDIGDF